MTVIPTIDIVDALAAEYAAKSPREILELALSQQGEIAISFSGAEDVVLIDMASRLGKPFRVFSLDTGRLHPETYQFIETVRKHYNINIEICFPDAEAVQSMVKKIYLNFKVKKNTTSSLQQKFQSLTLSVMKLLMQIAYH